MEVPARIITARTFCRAYDFGGSTHDGGEVGAVDTAERSPESEFELDIESVILAALT